MDSCILLCMRHTLPPNFPLLPFPPAILYEEQSKPPSVHVPCGGWCPVLNTGRVEVALSVYLTGFCLVSHVFGFMFVCVCKTLVKFFLDL